ncbi:hypothetical protein LJC07_03910 [Christensenellaceae bacterium OttesenSCG-928-L17]|nr:hypothetical protein [Christensenellaceae bacterium OttesenSCG-928-L17]
MQKNDSPQQSQPTAGGMQKRKNTKIHANIYENLCVKIAKNQRKSCHLPTQNGNLTRLP